MEAFFYLKINKKSRRGRRGPRYTYRSIPPALRLIAACTRAAHRAFHEIQHVNFWGSSGGRSKSAGPVQVMCKTSSHEAHMTCCPCMPTQCAVHANTIQTDERGDHQRVGHERTLAPMGALAEYLAAPRCQLAAHHCQSLALC